MGQGGGREGTGERTREGEQRSSERVVKSLRPPRPRGPFLFFSFFFLSGDVTQGAPSLDPSFFLSALDSFDLSRFAEDDSPTPRLLPFSSRFIPPRLRPPSFRRSLSLPPAEGMRASHTLTSSQLTIALSETIPLVNARCSRSREATWERRWEGREGDTDGEREEERRKIRETERRK